MNDVVIDIQNLSKSYTIVKRDGSKLKYLFSKKTEEIKALNNINFSVQQGEMIGLVGPNGAGKSTMLKILTGILMPSQGKVNVLGKDPFKNRKYNAAHIGVVFGQRSQLWWDLPVLDTFTLLKKIYKIPDIVFEENMEVYRKNLQIDEILQRPVRQLSLGQRMRAEVMAALLHNPKILFLDEPTIGLDIVLKREIRKFIMEMHERYGTTVILTSHDMKDIEEVTQRIVMIDHGRKILDDSLDNLKKHYNDTAIVHVQYKHPLLESSIYSKEIKAEKSQYGLCWTYWLDKEKVNTAKFIYELSKQEEITDIQVEEKSVEDIIHDLYLKN